MNHRKFDLLCVVLVFGLGVSRGRCTAFLLGARWRVRVHIFLALFFVGGLPYRGRVAKDSYIQSGAIRKHSAVVTVPVPPPVRERTDPDFMSIHSGTYDEIAEVQSPSTPVKYPGTVTPPLVLVFSSNGPGSLVATVL